MLTRRTFGISAATIALAWAAEQLPERRVAYVTVQLDGHDGPPTTDYLFVSYQADGQTRPQVVTDPGKLKYAFAYAGDEVVQSLPVETPQTIQDRKDWNVKKGDVLTCEFKQQKDGRTWAIITIQRSK